MTENKTGNKSGNRLLLFIILILCLIIAFLSWQLVEIRKTISEIRIVKEEAVNKNQDLQKELDVMLLQHDSIKTANAKLSVKLSAKDSIIMKNAEEIQKLIAVNADYRRIKRKLDYLRGITQSYVDQIDSLFTENKKLQTENIKIKNDYHKEKERNTELTTVKDQLTEKVNVGSMLKAYATSAVGLRTKGGGKEVISDKAKSTDKIKICFTLSENLIATSGSKDIYIRIAGPDTYILTRGEGDEYSFTGNGEKLQYSIKKPITYENKAMNLCLYWDKTKDFEPGKYSISIFADGIEIGQAFLELK